jgi:flagellin
MVTATTNSAANTAVRYLSINSMGASSSLAKLSSGSRIVKSSDDAASLAVGTKLKADVTALKQASVNASHAISLLQVADGGMAQISDILNRMKGLATQAYADTLSTTEQDYLDEEYQALVLQIDDITTQTKFNGQSLLDGTGGPGADGKFDFQVGVTAATDQIDVTINKLDTTTLTVNGTDIATTATAIVASGKIDAAIVLVNTARAEVGAYMSRFEFANANAQVSAENLDSARSVLMDVDVAAEMATFSSKQVLSQAATAMLAQANQMPQNLLRLLQ